MENVKSPYIAYMLRLWQVHQNGQLVWRASLESPKTGVRKGFIDPERLFAFLEAEMRRPHVLEISPAETVCEDSSNC
jgi:hypothetical protein